MAKKDGIPPTDPFQLFINARSFQITATILDQRKEHDFFLGPTMVTEAFALELHIKCLLCLRGISVTPVHEVDQLFDQLDEQDKRRIEMHLNKLLVLHPHHKAAIETGILMDLQSILKRGSNMFLRMRYWHEGILPARDENGHASNAGIGLLADAIMIVLLESCPDWHGRMKGIEKTFKFPGNTRLST